MTDTTPRSHLPLLAAAQAQKHVTQLPTAFGRGANADIWFS